MRMTDHDNIDRDAATVASAMFDIPADTRVVTAAIERLGLHGPVLNYAALEKVVALARANPKCPGIPGR